MQYASAKDWIQIATFPVDSSHAATAIESMAISRLTNQGFNKGRVQWINPLNNRESWADECFSCEVEHAISVVHEMAGVYVDKVA